MSPSRRCTRARTGGAALFLSSLAAVLVAQAPSGVASFVPSSRPAVSGRHAAQSQSSRVNPLTPLSSAVDEDPQAAAIAYGEESRKYRRTVFGYDDWVRQRSQNRRFKNLNNFFDSGIYTSLKSEVAIVTGLTAFVVVWNQLLANGYVDLAGVQHDPLFGAGALPELTLPLAAFTTTGSFLGLLLTFRTNQSYNRWDEARKAWGLTINHTRNIVRKSAAWSSALYEPDDAKREAAVKKVEGAVWSFPRSLKRHLYSPDDDEDAYRAEVRDRLPEEQAEKLIAATHRPNRALFDITCAVNELPMHFMRRDEIDDSITVLIDQLGACERLFSSPIPLFYTRHTARFLSTWMIFLPFALYDPFKYSWNHFAAIPAAAIIAVFLFGIEELSIQLEEPFTILPLQVYSERIGNSIGEIGTWWWVPQWKDKGTGQEDFAIAAEVTTD